MIETSAAKQDRTSVAASFPPPPHPPRMSVMDKRIAAIFFIPLHSFPFLFLSASDNAGPRMDTGAFCAASTARLRGGRSAKSILIGEKIQIYLTIV